MADPKQLAILKNGGVAGWNKWRAYPENLRPDLTRGILNIADLRAADLRGAELRGVDMRDADLRCANLGGADLSWANLRGANLRDADLSGADLRGTSDLTQEQLDGAWGSRKTTLPNGFLKMPSESPY